MTEADHKFLVDYLRDRDEPCPACKYNLRNLTGTRCPECGEELQLRISPVEPRQAAPIAGLIGLCMGLGLSTFFLCIVVYVISQQGFNSTNEPWVLPFVFAGAAAHGVATLCWLKLWQRIRRSPKRWALVFGAWMLPVIYVVVLLNSFK